MRRLVPIAELGMITFTEVPLTTPPLHTFLNCATFLLLTQLWSLETIVTMVPQKVRPADQGISPKSLVKECIRLTKWWAPVNTGAIIETAEGSIA